MQFDVAPCLKAPRLLNVLLFKSIRNLYLILSRDTINFHFYGLAFCFPPDNPNLSWPIAWVQMRMCFKLYITNASCFVFRKIATTMRFELDSSEARKTVRPLSIMFKRESQLALRKKYRPQSPIVHASSYISELLPFVHSFVGSFTCY